MSPKLRRFLAQYGMLSACMFILAVFLLLPIGLTVYGGLVKDVAGPDGTTNTVFTLEHVSLVFENPLYREGLINSFGIACATTLLSACRTGARS